MRARSRHLNPKGLGAVLAFDARFAPYANGDLVSSLTDRAAGATFTASGSLRPTFTTNVSGGSPAILSASGKRLSGDTTSYIGSNTVADASYLFVGSSDNSSGDQAIMTVRNATGWEFLMVCNGGGSYWALRTVGSGRNWTRPGANVFGIEAMVNSTAYVNGAAVSSNSHTHGGSGNTNAICNAGSQDTALKGYLGQVIVINAILTAPQLKRLTHAAAFAFKLACS